MDDWYDLSLDTCKGLETSGVSPTFQKIQGDKRVFVKASQLKQLRAKL
jgi:hypothetical protein